ncbi:MAG: SMP-30/gluconolactonase/LRE family protein [Cyclobacteriaceae bacterium]
MKKLGTILFFLFTTSVSFSQEIIFEIPEKDLITEGIAFDPLTKDFYISSIFKNKIVKISKQGVSDFIESDQDGFVGGVGLHVDSKRRILWACSGNIIGKSFSAGIFAYDLKTKKLLKKFSYPLDTIKRFFNDLVISPDGSIYITDTYGHCIWKWSMSMKEPIKLKLNKPFTYPNGITISRDGKFLLVATDNGLQRVDIKSNIVETIKMNDDNVSSKGLDGIELYKNSIIGIQNALEGKPNKVIRYFLSNDFQSIHKTKIIDSNNKYFDVPTTLAIANGYLYVLANSQMDNLNQENLTIIAPEKLTSTYILKYRLH